MRFFVTILVLMVSMALAAAQGTKPAPLSETESLKAQLEYKSFLLEQSKYDVLYQQFIAVQNVKDTIEKIQAMQKSLAEMERKLLETRGLKREEFFVDFLSGDIKPVPKKQAESAPQSPTP